MTGAVAAPGARIPAKLALPACLLLTLAACGDDDTEEVETVVVRETEEPEPPPEEVPAEAPLFTRSRPLMGTVFIIKVDADPQVAAPAVEAAFDEIERLETVLSEWREDSEISRINQQSGGDAIEVGPEVFEVVKAGVDVSRWSQGAFDISWAALRGLYDFRPGHRRVPDPAEVQPRLPFVDWERIEIDADARTVRLATAGMAIGTGGIGKGYALDRAGDILRDAGIESYMLFGGGQVQVHGLRGDRPWRVGIQHPRRAEEYFAFFETEGGSISTSGDYEHFYVDEDGQRWHHILDTDTGLPARRSVSVTLLADSGLYADALSTAAFVLGPEKALEMLVAIDEHEVEAVILDSECRLYATPGTEDRLRYQIDLDDGVLPGC